MKKIIKKTLSLALLLSLVIGVATNANVTKAAATELSQAEEIQLKDSVSTTINQKESHYYKFFIPEDVKDQELEIIMRVNSDFKGFCYLYVLDEYGQPVVEENSFSGCAVGNSPYESPFTYLIKIVSKIDENSTRFQLLKGQTYIIRIESINGEGTYTLSTIGSLDKSSKLSVSGLKKNSKKITASTIPGAKVRLTIKKKAGKTYKKTIESNSSGKAFFKISKLIKGDIVTVTSKKTGYETKTKKKTIK